MIQPNFKTSKSTIYLHKHGQKKKKKKKNKKKKKTTKKKKKKKPQHHKKKNQPYSNPTFKIKHTFPLSPQDIT